MAPAAISTVTDRPFLAQVAGMDCLLTRLEKRGEDARQCSRKLIESLRSAKPRGEIPESMRQEVIAVAGELERVRMAAAVMGSVIDRRMAELEEFQV